MDPCLAWSPCRAPDAGLTFARQPLPTQLVSLVVSRVVSCCSQSLQYSHNLFSYCPVTLLRSSLHAPRLCLSLGCIFHTPQLHRSGPPLLLPSRRGSFAPTVLTRSCPPASRLLSLSSFPSIPILPLPLLPLSLLSPSYPASSSSSLLVIALLLSNSIHRPALASQHTYPIFHRASLVSLTLSSSTPVTLTLTSSPTPAPELSPPRHAPC
ncbi:hypothetical protein CC85DRAFT_197757 [Cutaneotrichosporon oleaginosum]|uniref:Uncharacterized protein n=1 Tax=Cutaneotrichosporon oleaginosum TaxID=879819 RepID=A0A0J0XDZ3_9TREE|nr:uncharacterized protein CC85DRAFT_197757 [Cutaneotrichosporon oleaginosum]KLT39325.1 hypothetical protein CC85DRAFT_197757 [Cutaneotrichosporon oleaginosum]TXT08521.1 hypothetical protein COLE_05445 [Cutaneotrichosporon oleaginosum]